METKEKQRIIDFCEIVVIFVFVIIRIMSSYDGSVWINCLNFAGVILALYSLYADVYGEYSKYEKINIITGVFYVILVPLLVIAALIVAEILVPNTKCNDIILLVTLLISLPSRLYKDLIGIWIKNE